MYKLHHQSNIRERNVALIADVLVGCSCTTGAVDAHVRAAVSWQNDADLRVGEAAEHSTTVAWCPPEQITMRTGPSRYAFDS